MLWAVVFAIADDDGSALPQQLRIYAANSAGLMRRPRDPAEWQLIADLMRLFGLEMKPLKIQNWVRKAQEAPDPTKARERGCFPQWRSIVAVPEAYAWLRGRLGLPEAPTRSMAEGSIDAVDLARQSVLHCVRCCIGIVDARAAAAAAEDFAPSFVHLASLHFHRLPENIGERCTELVARRNMLCALPTSLPCAGLRRLNLSGNRLRELPGPLLLCLPRLARLARLRELRVPNNTLQTVPDGLATLASLRVLDLSANQLTDIPFGGARLASGAAPLVNDNLMCGVRQPNGDIYHLLEARLRHAEARRAAEEEEENAARQQARTPALQRLRRAVRGIIIASRWPVKAAYRHDDPKTARLAGLPPVAYHTLDDLGPSRWLDY